MSVIIRLQNLPWSANALDIRQYFQGLSIPEGGVHIVGGELGDAFIAFSTDEDARQAFNLNSGKIKEVQIKLMLSSRTEMQKVIESARNQSLAAFMQPASTPGSLALPAAVPPIVPAAVPEVKKSNSKEKDSGKSGDKKEGNSKRRSRSRSRERKERSKDKDRRGDNNSSRRHNNNRSRSRSRERRDRRRRERSKSRDRTTSRDRKGRNDNKPALANFKKDAKQVVWETPLKPDPQQQPLLLQKPATLLGNFVPNIDLEEARRNLGALNVPVMQAVQDRLLFGQNSREPNFGRARDTWPPNNGRPDFSDELMSPRPSLLGGYNQQMFANDGRGFHRMMGGQKRFAGEGGPQQRNCCVEVCPFYGAYGDVRRFFQGLFINNTGIKYVSDEFGKRNGVVYVRFAYAEGKEQALERDGNLLRNTPVEVRHIDDEVFDAYVPTERVMQDFEGPDPYRTRNVQRHFNNRSAEIPPKVFTCLVVEDLPSFAKEQDILKMFSDYPLTSILVINRSRHNHVAYAKFSNPEDAKKALGEKVKHVVDGKPVTVRPCREEDFAAAEQEQNGGGDVEIIDETSHDALPETKCVVLNDLPAKITDRDISDFFSDIGLVPLKINLLTNHLGFTGTAFCEFANKEDAITAVEKDGTPLGTNVVTVKLVARSEMDSVLGTPQGHPMGGNHHQQPLLSRPYYPRNNYGLGNRPNFMGPRMRRYQPQAMPLGQEIGPPGCTVLMENVPYKAGLDEILEFFDGFDIRTDSVLRRFNDNGTPSGEAKVLFNSVEDASQAVQMKRGYKIRDRPIYLTQC